MPRQKKTKSREPKKRSRKGCWPCKARKVKCGEEHPACMNRYATKSFVEEEDNYDNSRPSYKPIQLRPHELSVEINQASDGSVQALGGAESHTERAVVFVDESHELLNSFGLSEGNNAKRRLEHSPATAWSGDIVGRSNWAALPSLESPDSCISGNGGSDNSPSHSGHMWEGPRMYGLHETLSNLEVFPCGDGTFYGYDSGIVDGDLLESDDANTVVLLSPAAHNSAHGVVDLGEEAVYGQRRVRSSGLNQSYYENLVPVVIPWALEPLPDM
ncbi:hypothetical protein ED733_004697 [Metarhizium rileyi]|uniref:Zn(2)-C6 fungal-type domain-containing protein n=1 Tax=Metarhizium rileyi (strain RCEF 4871) TaxID=1649241 RepID=A0A5C6GEG7_METRR|nr:hypothetical protein ED733_004697 [Metarhizium rileyi]